MPEVISLQFSKLLLNDFIQELKSLWRVPMFSKLVEGYMSKRFDGHSH